MILDVFQWVNRLKTEDFKIESFLTEKIVRNDETITDADFVQDHSGKVPEGKENLNT